MPVKPLSRGTPMVRVELTRQDCHMLANAVPPELTLHAFLQQAAAQAQVKDCEQIVIDLPRFDSSDYRDDVLEALHDPYFVKTLLCDALANFVSRMGCSPEEYVSIKNAALNNYYGEEGSDTFKAKVEEVRLRNSCAQALRNQIASGVAIF